MKYISVAEMRNIDIQTDAVGGVSFAQLMENAGRGIAEIILDLPDSPNSEDTILALVGPGNNGGDALVALENLAAEGWDVTAYLFKRKMKDDALVERVKKAGGKIITAQNDKDFEKLTALTTERSVFLDGLFGTGIKLPLRENAADLLGAASDALESVSWAPYIVAIDCPSGIDSDSGEAAPETIPADITVTMAAIKFGLLKLPAFELCGDIAVVDIGVTDKVPDWVSVSNFVVSEDQVAGLLPERPLSAHKGMFGTALIAAGSVNYTGAALLAGKAAYRIGAGLVTLAIPSILHSSLAGQFPETTWVLLPHKLGVVAADAASILLENLERATALLVGPGFGVEETTRDFIENLLKLKGNVNKTSGGMGFIHGAEKKKDERKVELPPLVFDADGLKLLAQIENWHGLISEPAVLTPHPGEMAVMTGLSVAEIQADRLEIAKKYAQEWGHVVVLKGAFTVIAAPNGETYTIPVASPSLARAGSGDVLAGLIVGLRAQGLNAVEAAVAGSWIHAQAGMLAGEMLGASASVLAGDILSAVPDILADLE
ncbi:MAG: NAD(P)H-hydrate dehydratase [Anaerolineae bacterium]|nr:NAD(P)H-hydrate dehydratase [Anaerolineae bacterium]MBT7070647.1 NAD(P)H-hydrate dehydratase [Anaerolineae bacterium]MBT7326275.1 NAD(P)H-hydrate dehydratase [Anaerolineae bacterium]